MRFVLRILAVAWASPTTLVGALALGLAVVTGGRVALVKGVLEAHGGWIRPLLARFPVGPGGVAALTLGHVVLGASPAALTATRTHERVHVAQCERWGPLFLPAYAMASLWALLRGRHPYRDNPFEREAFAVETRPEANPTPTAGSADGSRSA